jgi:alginate O-acetyltransferase complex protein AlgI
MVFSSHLFLFCFLPLALGLYYISPRWGRHGILTALSYVFYGWANPAFMALMLLSTAIDYLCGLLIARQTLSDWKSPLVPLERGGARTRAQKTGLVVSIVSNLLILGFFKYFNFFVDSFDSILAMLGAEGWGIHAALRITLPLGISFYTFQSMSYSIDVYRGDATAIRNPVDFACYVSMFPQLVAGPIIRFSEVDDQLRTRTHTVEKFARGVAFISFGLAKKTLLANPCGKVADIAFGSNSLDCLDAWFGVAAYAFQIYFDFSGYSDMAIGLGLMFGFVFAKNFDSPYRSASITEFWRRWHISLSFWLRDYLYIPLGGNRISHARTYVNLAVVMILGGLWHGAAWNFVVWGCIHGLMLGFERAFGKDSFYRRCPHWIKVLFTFVIILFTWVFFRAADFSSALRYCGSMLGLTTPLPSASLVGGLVYKPLYIGTFCAAAIVTWLFPQTWDFTKKITAPRAALVLVVFLLAVIVLTTQEFNPFIYFIF